MNDAPVDLHNSWAALRPLPESRRMALRFLLGSGLGIAIAERVPVGAHAGSRLADDNWRRCRKCRGLFWARFSHGVCPKGGRHSAKRSKNYQVEYGEVVQSGEEGEWRGCAKCQGLFWGGNGLGDCPSGGAHDPAASRHYILEINQFPELGEESGWRYCDKCHGLFVPKGKKRGKCPAGGSHAILPNFEYNLDFIS